MQQSILKFYCFVVQTLFNMFRALLCPSSRARKTAVAASGFRMNVRVAVFSAVTTATSTFIRKPEAATAVLRAPDDGHNNARNMSVRQSNKILRLIVASSWVFYSSD